MSGETGALAGEGVAGDLCGGERASLPAGAQSGLWRASARPPAQARAHLQGEVAKSAFGSRFQAAVATLSVRTCVATSRRTPKRSLQQEYKPIIRRYAAKRARNKRCRGDGAQPAQALAGTMDLRQAHRRRADQQPTPSAPCAGGHLPQALPRQPIRRRRATHSAAALRAHPPAAYCFSTSPTRSPHSPRRPSPATHVSDPTN